jgi:hypothetical protein
MEPSALDRVCQSVYRQFPELRGSRPSVKQNGSNYLIIFSGHAKTADGKSISRTVRVTASESGSVLKLTTSR